jgi:hypothetical protein
MQIMANVAMVRLLRNTSALAVSATTSQSLTKITKHLFKMTNSMCYPCYTSLN